MDTRHVADQRPLPIRREHAPSNGILREYRAENAAGDQLAKSCDTAQMLESSGRK
jgi:hypothetical protein